MPHSCSYCALRIGWREQPIKFKVSVQFKFSRFLSVGERPSAAFGMD